MGSAVIYVLLMRLAFYVGRSWMCWFQSHPRLPEPRWRNCIALIGFAAASSSLGLILALAIHAFVTGGFPYYHPVLMTAMGLGFLLSFVGIVALRNRFYGANLRRPNFSGT